MTTIPEDSSLGIQPKEIKYSGAKIIIYAPVTLEMQPEKTKFITLYDSLDYFTKADIISTLKNVSFKGEPYKRSRYELDFLYEKSTMYQKQKIVYEEYSKYHPITWWRSLYFITMGLGYRPFWLLYWALGLIITFTMWYFISMKKQIKNYLYKDEKGQVSKYQRYRIQNQSKKDHWLDILINCFYFSTMLFFTFRLKKDILISFSKGKRWLIVTEWSLGFLMYVAFLTLSKSGSILHTIKSLFVV